MHAQQRVFINASTSPKVNSEKGDDFGEERVINRSLGEWIRYYRIRRRQIHNGRPWAQEDLAVAIGSDKAHINRIERGLKWPQRETLLHICDALELSWEERMDLLGLARYLVPQAAPTPEEIEDAIQYIRPVAEGATHPVVLIDQETRYWDGNDIFAYAELGYPGRTAWLAELRGMSVMELLLNDDKRRWWQRVIVDYDHFVERHLARFRSEFRYRQHDPKYLALMQGILSNEELKSIWTKLCLSSSCPENPIFLDSEQVEVRHPKIGRFKFQVWRSRLASDERFVLSQHLPVDAQSRRLFADLADRFNSMTR